MANETLDSKHILPFSFSDFPEDVQLCILSFLTPSDVSAFGCTSKQFVSLCRDDAKLWFSMCERRWGSRTHIRRWGDGKVSYKQLYGILNEYENLIGFWRRSGHSTTSSPAASAASDSPPSLVFFEWGPFFITGSRLSPSKNGTHEVIKEPFLWFGVAPGGRPISFLNQESTLELSENMANLSDLGIAEGELVHVNVAFIGKQHAVVEENPGCLFDGKRDGNGNDDSHWSLLNGLMSQVYQHIANRTSPRGIGSRKQRRREKERQGRKKWGPEHFVKIVDCSPTSSRPLQGLWKGICEDMNLDFFLVTYDDLGGIACRRIGDCSKPFSGHAPVFWTSSTRFIEPPFSPEEEYIFESRIHLDAPETQVMINEEVLHILNINSSYDLVIPDLAGNTVDPRQVEGRVWQYKNSRFGIGFLRDDFIVNLEYIAHDGCLLDTIELCNN